MAFQSDIPKHIWIHSIITKCHFPRLNTFSSNTHINYILLHIYTALYERDLKNQTLKLNRNSLISQYYNYIFTNYLGWPTTAHIVLYHLHHLWLSPSSLSSILLSCRLQRDHQLLPVLSISITSVFSQ